MDITLADYIKRIQDSQDRERQKVIENRNVWNDPALTSQDTYNVYPEDDGTDRPQNPYSQA